MLEEVKLEVDMIEERFEEDFRLKSRVVKGLGFSCPSRSSLDTIVLLALFSDLTFGFRSALGLLMDFRRSMRASMFANLRSGAVLLARRWLALCFWYTPFIFLYLLRLDDGLVSGVGTGLSYIETSSACMSHFLI